MAILDVVRMSLPNVDSAWKLRGSRLAIAWRHDPLIN